MKYIFLIVAILFGNISFSQSQLGDTVITDTVVKPSFGSRLFYYNPLQKHHNIFDLEFIDLEPSPGFIGYTYEYSLNQRVSVGGRFGLKHFKSKDDVPKTSSTLGVNYTVFGVSNVRIWRSIQAEFGVGLGSALITASKENTDFKGTKHGSGELLLRAGINFTLWRHLNLKAGYLFTNDFKPSNKWSNVFIWSVGYRF